MAHTSYNKSIASDFSGDFSANNWAEEIAASAIIIALHSVAVDGDTVETTFKEALSSGDESIFDSLSSAHNPEETTEISVDISNDKLVTVIDDADKTLGYSNRKGFSMDVAAQTIGAMDITIQSLGGWDILEGAAEAETRDYGDRYWFEVFPCTKPSEFSPALAPFNNVYLAALAGATTIYLIPGTVTYLFNAGILNAGKYIKFTSRPSDTSGDFTSYINETYLVINLSGSAGTITLDKPLVSDVAAGDPIFITHRFCDGAYMLDGPNHIGSETAGSSNVPQGARIRVLYENVGSLEKTVVFNLAYRHGSKVLP